MLVIMRICLFLAYPDHTKVLPLIGQNFSKSLPRALDETRAFVCTRIVDLLIQTWRLPDCYTRRPYCARPAANECGPQTYICRTVDRGH
jgi:hypothetical protein